MFSVKGMNYKVRYWDTDLMGFTKGRNLRNSAIYPRVEYDAVCGQSMGYERPLYFNTSSSDDFLGRGGIGSSKPWEFSCGYYLNIVTYCFLTIDDDFLLY